MGIMSSECPKCSGVMEEGFVDSDKETNGPHAIWFEGNPSSGKGGRKYRVQAHRCMSCGYTELYSEYEA